VARLAAPRDLHAVFDDPQVFVRRRPYIVPHALRGFALRPGYEGDGLHVNAAGLRGTELPVDLAARDVVLAVGESSTFGWRVGDDETYPAHLQHIFDRMLRPRPLHVLNAGVPSYTSPQVAAYLQELLPRYRPRIVLASVLWNDALFACMPNWMPDYLIHQRPAAWRRFLLQHSGLYRALAIREDRGGPTDALVNDRALSFYADNMTAMARTCRAHGVQLVFLRPSVDPARIPASGMRIGRRRVPADVFAALLGRFVTTLEQVAARESVPVVRHKLDAGAAALSSYFFDPVHPNGAGNAMIAEDIAAFLIDRTLPAEPLQARR
jgi:lysophospholipase L1-like esterase